MEDLELVLGLFQELASRPAVSGLEHGNIKFIEDWTSKQPDFKFKLEKCPGGLKFTRKDLPSLPSLVLTAHLDHPGFLLELVSEEPGSKRVYRAHATGRVPIDLLPNSRVQLYSVEDQVAVIDRPAPPRGYGRIRKDNSENPNEITFLIESETGDNGRATHAVYNLPSATILRDKLYSRSLDDLLGSALCLACLVIPFTTQINLTVLFTRGEEEGATGFKRILMSRKIFPSDTILAVETSKYSDESIPGKGVTIRSADSSREYSPRFVEFMKRVAKHYPDIPWQEMGPGDGRTEASSALGLGYTSAAISIPMLGYHNAGQNQIVPESCSISDIESAIEFLKVLVPAFTQYVATGNGQ